MRVLFVAPFLLLAGLGSLSLASAQAQNNPFGVSLTDLLREFATNRKQAWATASELVTAPGFSFENPKFFPEFLER